MQKKTAMRCNGDWSLEARHVKKKGFQMIRDGFRIAYLLFEGVSANGMARLK